MLKFTHRFLFAAIVCFTAFHGVSQETLKSEGEMPILAWIGVPESETSIERFQELKESGININFSWYSSIEAAEKALDIAQKVGIKMQVSCPELKSDPEGTVRRLMKHQALAGYHLQDEPNAADFKALGDWAKRIQAIDKGHYVYINLFPTYASSSQLFPENYRLEPGKDIYTAHVEQLVKEVPVPFVSFDHYPVIEDKMGVKSLRPSYYKNLHIIAKVSSESDLPFWAFSLAVAHTPYPIPTIGEMKLQMYSNLAYGAQGLQYFTYWTPISTNWDFHSGPITAEGKRTVVYDRIKLINQEIQHRAGVFLNANLVWVAHTGKHIPEETARLHKLPAPVKLLETSDGGAIVSLLEKGSRQFMVVVNRDFQDPMSLTFAADESVKVVQKDGVLVPATAYASKIEVDPGDAVIYTWNTGG